MPRKLLTFENGVVTSRDPSALRQGELQVAQGCEYREGTKHIYKQPGRKEANPRINTEVQALQHFIYEGDEDLLIAYGNTGQIFETSPFSKASEATKWTLGVGDLTKNAIPTFTSMRNSWIMVNGIDTNRVREIVFDNINPDEQAAGFYKNWRTLGMQKPAGVMRFSTSPSFAGVSELPDTYTVLLGDGVNSDSDEELGRNGSFNNFCYMNIPARTDDTGPAIERQKFSYKFAAPDATAGTANRTMSITMGLAAGNGDSPSYSTVAMTVEILDDTKSYHRKTVAQADNLTNFNPGSLNLPNNYTTYEFDIPDAVDILANNFRVEYELVSLVVFSSFGLTIAISAQAFIGNTEIRNGAASEEFSTPEVMYYAYAERYTDTRRIEHTSSLSVITSVSKQTLVKGIVFDGLPGAPINDFAQEYVIYRTLSEEGAGYPFMYEVGTVQVGDTTWTDIGERSFTDIEAQNSIVEYLVILYPDGSTTIIDPNGPPPLALKALTFQGSMVYLGINSQRLTYSLPASISPIAYEKVPDQYYLDFVTPYNDTLRSAETTNSGKSLIVYFDRYSMLVNFLPQATDPGVFTQRITEYVSNTRGAVNPHATVEFTIDGSRTIAAAVDGLGLWISDGISKIQDWSDDLDWQKTMLGVNMRRIQLLNNPEMYRLELLYEQDAQRKELHFFYGRNKKDGEDDLTGIITGPHLTGVRCKHFANIAGRWTGWSGDDTREGRVFVEREQAQDDSHGYSEQSKAVKFVVQTGDDYLEGLGQSAIVKSAFPKFSDGTQKTVDVTGTFRRDGNAIANVKKKQFEISRQKKLYWSAYADRHNVTITDDSDTELPALIAYELDIRDAGRGED